MLDFDPPNSPPRPKENHEAKGVRRVGEAAGARETHGGTDKIRPLSLSVWFS